jgi:hypothetical protein
MRRGLVASWLSAVVVTATLLGPSAASASPTSPTAAPLGCGPGIWAAAIRSDNVFVTRNADPFSSPPQDRAFGTVSSPFPIQALSNSVFDDDLFSPPGYWRNYAYATTANSLEFIDARNDFGTNSATVTRLANRWAGFRQLVWAGFSGYLPSDQLYGLNTNGYLYRYRWSVPDSGFTTAAGRVAGFADIKTMSVVGRTSTYDALLANTYSGQLVLLKIPLSNPMSVTRIVVRTRTWQVFNNLIVVDCMAHDGSTTLLATTPGGTGVVYTLAHLTGPSSGIYPRGQAGGTWTEPFIIQNEFLGWSPNGA